MKQRSYPACLIVDGRDCWVVGEGDEALDRAHRLAAGGANVTFVGGNLSLEQKAKLSTQGVGVREHEFQLTDVTDQFLIVYCPQTDPDFTKALWTTCRAKRVLLCAIDQPDYCDITNVSVYERGLLRIMVSTSGAAPALAKKIRKGLEASLADVPLDRYVEGLAHLRNDVLSGPGDKDAKRRKLIEAVEGFLFESTAQLPAGWDKKEKQN